MRKSEEYMKNLFKIFIITILIVTMVNLPVFASKVINDKLAFTETELFKVMEIFSELGGVNIFLDEDVKNKKITFFAKGLSLKKSLDMIVITNNLELKKMGKTVYVIYPKKKKDIYKGEVTSFVFRLNNREPKNLLNIIKGISKKTKVYMNETINAIVMIDTIENIRKAKSILKQLDSMRRQVLIDVKLVEIQKDYIKELGPAFSNSKLSFGEFKELATSKTTMILNTLIETGKGTVLASPRIRVLDKEEAEINVGDKIPIEITTSSRTAGGDNIDLNKSVQWENVGIKLKIECKKIHDNDDVTIKLYNEVSSVVSYTAGGYPHIRTRNANTTLRLTDGVTVAFGGLINSTEEKKSNDIPFLSKLPGIGKIFQDIRHNDVKTEIVMFITPRLKAEVIKEISENKPDKDFIKKTIDLTGSGIPQKSEIKIEKNEIPIIELVEKTEKKSLRSMRALLKKLKRNSR